MVLKHFWVKAESAAVNMLAVLQLDVAQALVEKHISLDSEVVSLQAANRRILAKDIRGNENIPQFKRSLMDGYCVQASATFGASQTVPAIFKYAGEILMGQSSDNEVAVDHCLYVPTGGMVPNDCNGVVMIEHCSRVDNEVFVYHPIKPNENIVQVGEDLQKDAIILKRGTFLDAAKIGILAGGGISSVEVVKKFKYSLISTGDEIVPIDASLTQCQIRDVNSYALEAKLQDYGILTNRYLLKDDLELLKKTIKTALSANDVVLISGGSSVGARDYTLQAIKDIEGEVLVHGLALKPGKPTMVATYGDKLIIGLPGHPMAALVSLQLIFVDCFKKCCGCEANRGILAKAKINFPSASGRATIMPVKLEKTEKGWYATPLFYKSGLINILAHADGVVIIPSKAEGIDKDTILEVQPL